MSPSTAVLSFTIRVINDFSGGTYGSMIVPNKNGGLFNVEVNLFYSMIGMLFDVLPIFSVQYLQTYSVFPFSTYKVAIGLVAVCPFHVSLRGHPI